MKYVHVKLLLAILIISGFYQTNCMKKLLSYIGMTIKDSNTPRSRVKSLCSESFAFGSLAFEYKDKIIKTKNEMTIIPKYSIDTVTVVKKDNSIKKYKIAKRCENPSEKNVQISNDNKYIVMRVMKERTRNKFGELIILDLSDEKEIKEIVPYYKENNRIMLKDFLLTPKGRYIICLMYLLTNHENIDFKEVEYMHIYDIWKHKNIFKKRHSFCNFSKMSFNDNNKILFIKNPWPSDHKYFDTIKLDSEKKYKLFTHVPNTKKIKDIIIHCKK